MIKLLKYELKNMYLPYIVVSVLYLVCMLIISIYGKIGLEELSFKASSKDLGIFVVLPFWFAILGALLSFVGLLIVVVVSVINSFSKYLFGAYGSLLLSLPIKLDNILLAKILSNLVCIACASLFYLFCLMQVVSSFSEGTLTEFYTEVFKTLNEFSIGDILLFCFYWVVNTGNFLVMILLTLTLLNIWHINSFVFPIGLLIYFCISFVFGIVSAIVDVVFGISLADSIVDSLSYINNFTLFGFQGIKTLILCVGMYLIARFLIVKKLELS
ncbi:hypothetical protein [Helicobacter burdigaliensis]|uniref:hypothetical protein n=1 Tax=Helicobacter burdigaliensis TaxID=2315334 RepID=UPI000EF71ED8|nr:hypothetical protein [Helicobacter burdigaliensis]